MRTDFVRDLEPLLDRFGNDHRLTIILFTLDDDVRARARAPGQPLSALRLGPAWWFSTAPRATLLSAGDETAGFYNTVGFNDDTRAFPSIPARHDARRVDCAYLARLVAEHRLEEDSAEVAIDLAYRLVKAAYRL